MAVQAVMHTCGRDSKSMERTKKWPWNCEMLRPLLHLTLITPSHPAMCIFLQQAFFISGKTLTDCVEDVEGEPLVACIGGNMVFFVSGKTLQCDRSQLRFLCMGQAGSE